MKLPGDQDMNNYYAKLDVFIEANNIDEAQELLEKIATKGGCEITPIGDYAFGIALDVEEET